MGGSLGCSTTDRGCCGCSAQNDILTRKSVPCPNVRMHGPGDIAEAMGMETDTMHDLTAVAAAAGLATASQDAATTVFTDDRARASDNSRHVGLVIVFRLPEGSEKTVSFGNRQPPLGMDFSTKIPVNVKRVKPDGHAAELGVREEWVIKSINGDSVQGWEPKEIFSKLSKVVMGEVAQSPSPASPATSCSHGMSPSPAMSPIPAISLASQGTSCIGRNCGMVLGFRTADGLVMQVNFADRRPPLGMDFERTAPVRVKRVIQGGHAETLGVKSAWTVVSVNGEDVENIEFTDVFARMRVASSTRPEMPAMVHNVPFGQLNKTS